MTPFRASALVSASRNSRRGKGPACTCGASRTGCALGFVRGLAIGPTPGFACVGKRRCAHGRDPLLRTTFSLRLSSSIFGLPNENVCPPQAAPAWVLPQAKRRGTHAVGKAPRVSAAPSLLSHSDPSRSKSVDVAAPSLSPSAAPPARVEASVMRVAGEPIMHASVACGAAGVVVLSTEMFTEAMTSPSAPLEGAGAGAWGKRRPPKASGVKAAINRSWQILGAYACCN